MKKWFWAICLFLLILITAQLQPVQALQKTYDWNIPSGIGGADNKYQISLITSDGWLVDTDVDVTFRLTLVQKSSTLADTETNWVRIILNSENFITDSGNQGETAVLKNIGDYWEKKVTFNILAEKVNRGQLLNVSMVYLVKIVTIDNIRSLRWEHTKESYDNPMYIGLYRPWLSFIESIAVVAVIVIGGISGFLAYRRIRRHVKPQSPSP